MYELFDYVSGKQVYPDNLVFTGSNSPWEVNLDFERLKSKIDPIKFRREPCSIRKYLPFMPVKDPPGLISLNEGNTPLMRSRRLGENHGLELYFKIESRNPTGAFKDRGTAIEVSIAREYGAKAIVVASTGNMAASCACYAAAAGIPCFVFVPEGVPYSKLLQVLAFGARVIQVQGSYNDAEAVAKQVAGELRFYLCGDYAFRLEGAKTAAYEVIEQLNYQVPDAVVVPMGCGTNLAAIAKGFKEFYDLGLTDRLPAMIGVQASGAAAIVNSYHRRERTITPLQSVATLASAIAVPNPLDGMKALDAIYSTGGEALAVSDSEIKQSQQLLSKLEGIFIEPSGGAVIAACQKLAENPRWKGSRVVGILCGDGLKDPAVCNDGVINIPTIAPECHNFISLYQEASEYAPILAA